MVVQRASYVLAEAFRSMAFSFPKACTMLLS